MNAAARVINQSNLFNGQLTDIKISKQLMLIILLAFSVLASALAVVYSTNAYRSVFIQMEQAEQQSNRLQMQWGQLLLEQASLASPSRVQYLAQKKLNMALPETKNSFVLKAK